MNSLLDDLIDILAIITITIFRDCTIAMTKGWLQHVASLALFPPQQRNKMLSL